MSDYLLDTNIIIDYLRGDAHKKEVLAGLVAGGKLQHTLRQKGAGLSMGVEETMVSFDALVSEDGPERDYLKLLKKGTIKQLRVKLPGETLTINGGVSKRSVEIPLDDAVKYTIEFIGRCED